MAFSTVLKARTFIRDLRFLLLLHPRRLPLQIAEEVQLRATHARRPHHVDLVDDRRVQWKDALDALAERHLPDGERRTRAAAVHADHHAFEHLDAFLVAFAHLHVNADGVPRLHRRALGQLPALDGFYGSHYFLPSTRSKK